jgi:hypothetical protein
MLYLKIAEDCNKYCTYCNSPTFFVEIVILKSMGMRIAYIASGAFIPRSSRESLIVFLVK